MKFSILSLCTLFVYAAAEQHQHITEGNCCPEQLWCCFGNGNGVCYDPNLFVCTGTMICPLTHPNTCGEACYNPAEYVCNGTILCPVSEPNLRMENGNPVCYGDMVPTAPINIGHAAVQEYM